MKFQPFRPGVIWIEIYLEEPSRGNLTVRRAVIWQRRQHVCALRCSAGFPERCGVAAGDKWVVLYSVTLAFHRTLLVVDLTVKKLLLGVLFFEDVEGLVEVVLPRRQIYFQQQESRPS